MGIIVLARPVIQIARAVMVADSLRPFFGLPAQAAMAGFAQVFRHLEYSIQAVPRMGQTRCFFSYLQVFD